MVTTMALIFAYLKGGWNGVKLILGKVFNIFLYVWMGFLLASFAWGTYNIVQHIIDGNI